MRYLLLLVVLLLCPVFAAGQARTAERIVSVPHSQLTLDTTAPNGSVRHVINGLEGTTPCTAGGTGAVAYKIGGVWSCPKLTPGAGSGDVSGVAASSVGEMVLFTTTGGKNIGRSNALSGIPFLTAGVVSTLASSGTGDVARVTSPLITGLNASTVFGSGTVPPARIISNALTPNKCLRLSSAGAIETAAADCGSGGAGSPGGVSGNLAYNESGSFGGLAISSYSSVTGTLTLSQLVNNNDLLVLRRFTDTSSTGTLLRVRNAANSADLFTLSATGAVAINSTLTATLTAAPATPAAGLTTVWADSTDKNLQVKDDAGNISGTVRAITCTGTDKVSAISSAGVVTCSADQTSGGGSGITTLNTLTTASQTFADVDDTNIDLTIGSATSTHTFTVAWVGRLDAARMDINTVLDNASNTWTTGSQSFAGATTLTVPTAAGASPSASASIAYDSTSDTWEGGVNGTNRTFAFTAGAQTFADKTLANSTTANLRDTLLTLQDNTDATKTVNFELSGITTATNRVVTIVDAASMTVRPTTLTTNQWITHIDSAGVQQKAQPAFSNLSGSLAVTQGSTGQTAVAQGDLLFGDAANSWARLPKSTTATHVLLNTGASNNPAWGQVPLTTGVTGVLPPANWSVLTTKGDLLAHNGTTTVRHAVGTDGHALFADSTQTNGVRWGAITASAGGSTTQLQRNSAGVLAGISGATSDGTSVTFTDGALILNGGDYGVADGSMPGTPVEKAFYLNTNASSRHLFIYNNGAFRQIFQSGIDAINLASANVSGILPGANGGTNNGFMEFTGPTTSLKTFTLPNASATILTTNAAVTVPQGGTGLASGTSGGVPYFSSATTMASSGALTANLPVIGGGAGAAPTVGTRSGNTTAFVTTTGTLTSGRCAEWDASGNLIQAAAACGTGGSGANTALSNLAAVAINTSLISDTDFTDDLGSSSIRWRHLWAAGVIVGGASLTTEVDQSVGIVNGTVTLAKNDANARTFYGTLYKPVLNTGGSNTNTTFNVLAVDTTNTATTGVTTNLLNLAYGGATKATLTSDGNLTVTGSITGTGGGVAYSIANGTSALGTSAIASGTCATVVTTAATGTATTDVVLWGFNGDPTGVTGYAPSANGMLTIIVYPTTNNINIKVCNNLSASVTPGAITLNWRVVR